MRIVPYRFRGHYADVVYVTSGNDTEIRLTLEAMVDLVNALDDARSGDAPSDVRALLTSHGFTRAPTASAAAIARVESRTETMAESIRSLPEAEVGPSVGWINDALDELTISPSLTTHDHADLHIHWTPGSATFDDQVLADILMAVAQEVCDHGTSRFGRCGAVDCDHLFYDATRNRSRRFCNDPRCASRTHTADHRKRQRSVTPGVRPQSSHP